MGAVKHCYFFDEVVFDNVAAPARVEGIEILDGHGLQRHHVVGGLYLSKVRRNVRAGFARGAHTWRPVEFEVTKRSGAIK